MPNRPEYLAIWLGVTQVGGVVRAAQTPITTGAALAHCIAIADPSHVIIASELAPAFGSAAPHLVDKPKIWLHGEVDFPAARIDAAVDSLDGGELPVGEKARRAPCRPRALHLYVQHDRPAESANVSHHRI